MSFAQLAEERGIESAKAHVDQLHWDMVPDDVVRMPPAGDLDGIFQLLPRRGLEPMLVGRLLTEFPVRPLERALIAFDVLRGSLLGRYDDELRTRLAIELAPLKQLGPLGAVAIPRDRLATLIAAIRPSSDPDPLPSLAGLIALSATRKHLRDQPAVIDATFDLVKRLSLAHLPSLALAFLQILWDRFAVQAALDLMIEIGLDFRQLEAVPEVDATDDVSLQRKAYGLLRAKLAIDDLDGAAELNEVIDRVPATRDSQDPSLFFARVDLAVAQQRAIDPATFKVIETIAPLSCGWRYAAYVRDGVVMQMHPELTAKIIAVSIAQFGNCVDLWDRAARYPEVHDQLLRGVSRELRYVSHDPEVWRALAILVGDPAISNEVSARLAAQSAGDVVRPTPRWKRYGFAKDPN